MTSSSIGVSVKKNNRLSVSVGTQFPASVTGAGGIVVEKVNGDFIVHPDFSQLDEVQTYSGADTKRVWLWDSVTNDYKVISFETLNDAATQIAAAASAASAAQAGSAAQASRRAIASAAALTDNQIVLKAQVFS